MDNPTTPTKKPLSKIVIPAILLLVVLVAIAAFFIFQTPSKPAPSSSVKVSTIAADPNTSDSSISQSVSWSWSGSAWNASDTPPACSVPILSTLPVDLSKVTSILYPGQTRGGNYKPHGGFRFGNDNTISVTTPLEASLTSGSRYIEGGEVQYLFTFINSCGIAYRFDHLHTLSDKFQKLSDQLPAAKVDDSRTTAFEPPVKIAKGEIVATKVGFVTTANVSLDFGVYDLRKQNEASKIPTFATTHENSKEFAFYGICWLKELPAELSQKVLALPGSGTEGKTSDYCK